MKLRKILSHTGPQVEALGQNGWVSLGQLSRIKQIAQDYAVTPNLAVETLSVLQLGRAGWQDLQAEVDSHPCSANQDAATTLPIAPRSYRDFMLFENHVINASRGYLKRFNPGMLKVTNLYEKVRGKTFPKFLPKALWYQQPIYYFGNHLNFLAHEQDIPWPSYTDALDYELELGAILAKPLLNACSEEAEKAIGGFVVFNDVSARDVQVDEMHSGFGPQKAKHFISTMSDTLVTSDEVLPNVKSLSGSVSINGSTVAHCCMGEMKYSFGEILAFASKDEQLHPGELFGTGTLPGGSGMENGHWLKPGDALTMNITGIGKVSNTITEKGMLS